MVDPPSHRSSIERRWSEASGRVDPPSHRSSFERRWSEASGRIDPPSHRGSQGSWEGHIWGPIRRPDLQTKTDSDRLGQTRTDSKTLRASSRCSTRCSCAAVQDRTSATGSLRAEGWGARGGEGGSESLFQRGCTAQALRDCPPQGPRRDSERCVAHAWRASRIWGRAPCGSRPPHTARKAPLRACGQDSSSGSFIAD